MSQGGTVDEPSMDEILSSIRKIIAEDEVDVPRPQPKAAPSPAPVAAEPPPLDLGADDETDPAFPGDGDDVLELTADDETAADTAMLLDEDDVGSDRADADDDEPVAVAPMSGPPSPDGDPFADMFDPSEPAATPPVPVPTGSGAAAVMDQLTEVLLDRGAANVASGALQRLSAAVAPGEAVAGGNRSIETFLADLVRPELKTWLDHNLPPLVERIVEREIKKLVRDAQPD